MQFQFDQEKAIAVVLYIAKKINEQHEKCDFHKIFKILYFAESKHLATWGRPITGDYFIAMTHGPVPSAIYDIFKSVKGDSSFIPAATFRPYFEIITHFVEPKQEPDLNVLAESDLFFIDESIAENVHFGFRELVEKSHQIAWHKANKDEKMSYKLMAQEAGAGLEIMPYLQQNSENSRLFR
jgi:uncharacterized phage-associated protein